MKKILIVVCLLLPFALYARAIQEDYKKADEKARTSYAFGMIIGSNMESIELDFDYSAFTDGFKAGFSKSDMRFSEQEAIDIIETAIQISVDKRSAEYRIAEEEFLALNRVRPGVQVTFSGLQYEILYQTEGDKPMPDSIVKVHYEGSFINGNVFDKSYDEEGTAIPLDRVIPGWTEGIMLMSTGSKYRLYIPSSLAYGKEGIQNIIPPYSTLIFDVELLEIFDLDLSETDDDD
ncbi:MAG: FKBP-type peptidyl-prolyl cis-trans isomerase [Treponema sp.]|jgi:FKBP-type peptidyl-prolyl cis-trans isomerase|nr:FKBP-type peptidyl-prolyl cis-trans isomerase [Treponema sp.]